MEKTSFISLALTCLASIVSLAAPAISQEVGSQAAYQYLAGIQRQQIDADIRWNQAKKVCILTTDQFPDAPVRTINVTELAAGVICRLETIDFRVSHVIDATTVRYSFWYRNDWHDLIVKDCPTTGLADGDTVRLVGFLECLGPVDFYGSKVQTVSMLPAAEQREQIKLVRDNQDELAAAKLRADYPVWSLKDGGEVAGKFVKYGAGFVLLESPTGDQTKVKLSAFTKASADKLRELIKSPKASAIEDNAVR